jgi:hypothetical protein
MKHFSSNFWALLAAILALGTTSQAQQTPRAGDTIAHVVTYEATYKPEYNPLEPKTTLAWFWIFPDDTAQRAIQWRLFPHMTLHTQGTTHNWLYESTTTNETDYTEIITEQMAEENYSRVSSLNGYTYTSPNTGTYLRYAANAGWPNYEGGQFGVAQGTTPVITNGNYTLRITNAATRVAFDINLGKPTHIAIIGDMTERTKNSDKLQYIGKYNTVIYEQGTAVMKLPTHGEYRFQQLNRSTIAITLDGEPTTIEYMGVESCNAAKCSESVRAERWQGGVRMSHRGA